MPNDLGFPTLVLHKGATSSASNVLRIMQWGGNYNLISWSTVTILDSTNVCVCLLANIEGLTIGVPDMRVTNFVNQT